MAPQRTQQNKTKRQEQAKNTKKRIYDAFTKFMSERDFENITVDEICKMSGVRKGGFYHHFSSKDELIIETYRRIDSKFMDAIKKIPTDTPPRDYILFTTCFMAQKANDKGHELCQQIYRTQMVRATEFFISQDRPFYHQIYLKVEKSLEGKDISLFPSASDITKIILLSARGVIYDWSLVQGIYDIELLMKKTIGFLYDGIFKSV